MRHSAARNSYRPGSIESSGMIAPDTNALSDKDKTSPSDAPAHCYGFCSSSTPAPAGQQIVSRSPGSYMRSVTPRCCSTET